MKNLTLLAAVAVTAIVATAFGLSQLPQHIFGIQYGPHPRDYVEIRPGQMPFQVPKGMLLVVTGFATWDSGLETSGEGLFVYRGSDEHPEDLVAQKRALDLGLCQKREQDEEFQSHEEQIYSSMGFTVASLATTTTAPRTKTGSAAWP